MNTHLFADLRSMDPVAYIAAIGLQPEDSYGFVPVEHSDGSALLYLYRDRTRYAEARAGLPGPQRSRLLGGLIEVDRPEGLLASDPLTAAWPSAPVAAQRLYPGRVRSSGKQLNHFLPRYVETVGVRAEDVYGVIPRGIHLSGGESSAREWQSMWLVYRDRPEYAAGRARWDGESTVTPGAATPPAVSSQPGRVAVERKRWPKRNLLMRETGEDLGSRLLEALASPPERALGICPDFQQRKLYFAFER